MFLRKPCLGRILAGSLTALEKELKLWDCNSLLCHLPIQHCCYKVNTLFPVYIIQETVEARSMLILSAVQC